MLDIPRELLDRALLPSYPRDPPPNPLLPPRSEGTLRFPI
jgi:hypothetical protein